MALMLDQLSVTRGATIVLAPLSCTIPAGAVCAVIGPNGAGKSSLLAAIAGVLPDHAGGHAAWSDHPLHTCTAPQRARLVSYLAQTNHCPFPLAVRAVVDFARHPHRDLQTDAGRDVVDRHLALMDLHEFSARSVHTLSGGQWQRTCVARVLAQTTPLVLLDEPTAHLDLRYQQRLFAHCRALAAGGHTVLCALHDLPRALQQADWVIALDSGVTRFAGPRTTLPAQIMEELFGAVP